MALVENKHRGWCDTQLGAGGLCDCARAEMSNDGPIYAAPRETKAPMDLASFLDQCKAQGLRTAKGEFVASDGTRMTYDWAFERAEKKGAREDG